MNNYILSNSFILLKELAAALCKKFGLKKLRFTIRTDKHVEKSKTLQRQPNIC